MTTTAVKERPILFSGPMVRAILDGRKTQTRRIIKPQPPTHINELHGGELSKRAPYDIEDDEQRICGWGFQDDCQGYYRFPYGKVGDRLWVRESWSVSNIYDKTAPSNICVNLPKGPGRPPTKVLYPSTDSISDCIRRRPSIHMPRWASRITLEITGVRVERLQDISEADAAAEGCERIEFGPHEVHGMSAHPMTSTYGAAFADLWERINGPDSWAANPYVWVIEFKRREQ